MPTGQIVQPDALIVPALTIVPANPGAQIEQAETDVLDVPVVDMPTGQDVQDEAPAVEYAPKGQILHDEAPSNEDVPARHVEQDVEPAIA